jgi:hypothetical protein
MLFSRYEPNLSPNLRCITNDCREGHGVLPVGEARTLNVVASEVVHVRGKVVRLIGVTLRPVEAKASSRRSARGPPRHLR